MTQRRRAGVFVKTEGGVVKDALDAVRSMEEVTIGIGYADDETNTIAMANNFGTATIPARDFLTRAIAKIRTLNQAASSAFRAGSLAKRAQAKPMTIQALTMIGRQVIGAIHHELDTSRDWARANTDEVKRRKGHDQPLRAHEDRLRTELTVVVVKQ